MLFFESIKLAFQAIRVNKMRSFLTMLGIIIGISSVISIVSIGDTMRGVVADQYNSIGINRVMVYIGRVDDYRDSDYFSLDDVEKIRETFHDQIEYVDVDPYENVTITQGRNNLSASLEGVIENYSSVQNVNIVHGRMISEADVQASKDNIVIEDKTALELFGKENVVGETLRCVLYGELLEFNIIGVYHTEKTLMESLMGGGGRPLMYVPTTTIFSPYGLSFSIDLYTRDGIDTDVFQKQFIGMLARMKNREPENFVYYPVKEEMGQMDTMMAGLSSAVGAIAAISLLVGGIGIMNIMLVSVTERTREIGIRKALGARTKDVLIQFLIESAIISAAGGIIGTILGIGIVVIGGTFLGISVVVNPMIVVIAVAFSAVVGIFFGIYPARKAAKADPITALRYE